MKNELAQTHFERDIRCKGAGREGRTVSYFGRKSGNSVNHNTPVSCDCQNRNIACGEVNESSNPQTRSARVHGNYHLGLSCEQYAVFGLYFI